MNSLFNSIESLSKISTWLQISIVIFGILTAASIAFNIVVTKKISNLKDQKTTILQKKVEEAEYNLAPRKITENQKNIICKYLENKEKYQITIIHINGDSEAQSYASEIENILLNVNWKIIRASSTFVKKDPFHIHIRIHNKESIPEGALILHNAFKSADIFLPIIEFKGSSPDSIDLIVGHKLTKDKSDSVKKTFKK